ARIRQILGLGVGAAPSAPEADLGARPEEHPPCALPVEGDEVETRRRDRGRSRPHDADRQVLRDDGGVGGMRRAGGGGQEHQDEAEGLHQGLGSVAATEGIPTIRGSIVTAVRTAFLRALLASLALLTVLLFVSGTGFAGGTAQKPTDRPRVLAVEFDTDVNPVTQGYLNGEINRANNGGYDAVVILLDTPGGLSESMRKIVKKELSSKIPVIVYVSPNRARAASAGVS